MAAAATPEMPQPSTLPTQPSDEAVQSAIQNMEVFKSIVSTAGVLGAAKHPFVQPVDDQASKKVALQVDMVGDRVVRISCSSMDARRRRTIEADFRDADGGMAMFSVFEVGCERYLYVSPSGHLQRYREVQTTKEGKRVRSLRWNQTGAVISDETGPISTSTPVVGHD